MSLATRCPECAARLELVPDQLRIHRGWVRCGRCDAAFDAAVPLEPGAGDAGFPGFHHSGLISLPEQKRLAPLPRLPAQAETVSSPVNPRGQESPAAPADTGSVYAEATGTRVIAAPLLRPALTQDGGKVQGFDELRPVRKPDRGHNPQERRERVLPIQAVPPVAVVTTAPTPDDAATSDRPMPSFMRDVAGPAAAPSRKTRWPLHAAVLLLAAVLALQIVLEHRDRLAASAPASAPWLRQLCDALGCTVDPVRRISAIVIDHSSLNKVATGEYRLQLAVRNRSKLGLAMPAIELTLTDLQDRPIVRRVLLPSELGAGKTIAAHGEWTGAITVAVTGKIEHIVGYKALAFYP